MGFREVLLSEFLQTLAAVDGHVYRGHQSDQCLVRTNVRGRLLAANVLLACGESKHETSLAIFVFGLSHQAARHLAKIFFLAGEHSVVWSAKPKRNAE